MQSGRTKLDQVEKVTPGKINLEHDVVQWIVAEAVREAMKTPLRDSILAGVEETTEDMTVETEDSDTDSSTTENERGTSGRKSRAVTAIQGLSIFVVLFVVLYVSLRKVTTEDEP